MAPTMTNENPGGVGQNAVLLPGHARAGGESCSDVDCAWRRRAQMIGSAVQVGDDDALAYVECCCVENGLWPTDRSPRLLTQFTRDSFRWCRCRGNAPSGPWLGETRLPASCNPSTLNPVSKRDLYGGRDADDRSAYELALPRSVPSVSARFPRRFRSARRLR